MTDVNEAMANSRRLKETARVLRLELVVIFLSLCRI